MKRSRLLSACALAIAMVIIVGVCFPITAFATIDNINADDSVEKKVICNATIDDDFADDSILVMYKNDVSLMCNTITLDMFSSINAQSIENLSLPIEERVKSAKNKILEASTRLNIGASAETIEIDVDLKKFNQVVKIKLSETGKDKVLEAIKIIEKDENILYVGPNYLWKLSSQNTALDAYIASFKSQWACDQIQLSEALAYVESNKVNSDPIVVAVIDSGVQGNHEVFKSSDSSNSNDSIINPYKSKQFFNPNEDPLTDDYGHGTQVAGIIQGVANDYVELWSYRVSKSYQALSSDVYMAIREAYLEDVPIINLSMEWQIDEGSESSINYDEVLNGIMDIYNGLIVCAAGNNGAGDDDDGGANIDEDTNLDYYPAQYELSNVIVVGASTVDDGREFHSNYGNESVDVFAPGEQLRTTTITATGYTDSSGWTSMATPFVTGLAVLIKKVNPNLEPEKIIEIIKLTVDTDDTTDGINGNGIKDLWDSCTSHGRINAYKAVQEAIDYDTTLCPHSNATYTYTPDTHTLTCTVCSYLLTEAHNFQNNTYNVNTHTLTCSVCFYSLTEAHNDFSYTYNAYTHSLKCSDCPYITGNAVHTGSYVTYDANTHTYSCSVCSYTLSSAHELYVYSDNGEDGVTIKCNTCNYMRTCYVGVAEYGYANDTQHYVSCTCGCYIFLSPHIPAVVTSTGDLYTHQAFCRDCGVYYQAAHSWVAKSYGTVQGYECLMCNMFSISVPGIMQIPSGDEILIASGDENGTEITLLPEKEDDLVTE